jgi:hypothetical protein
MSMPLSGMVAIEQTARLTRSANVIAKSEEESCRYDKMQEGTVLISTFYC